MLTDLSSLSSVMQPLLEMFAILNFVSCFEFTGNIEHIYCELFALWQIIGILDHKTVSKNCCVEVDATILEIMYSLPKTLFKDRSIFPQFSLKAGNFLHEYICYIRLIWQHKTLDKTLY